jgi:two-component system, OmpR family, sensor histidine kinase TrcS
MTGARARTRRPATLRGRLVAGVVATLGIVLLGFGVLSQITLTATTTRVVDAQLSAGMTALDYMATRFAAADGVGFDKPLIEFVGQASGSVIAYVDDGAVVDSAIFSGSDPTPLPADVAAVVAGLDTGIDKETVDLGTLGTYRVMVEPRAGGGFLVAGVSMAGFTDLVLSEGVTLALIAGGALIVAAVGTVFVVRRELRPLEGIVKAARKVREIPLDRGDVAIREQVSIPIPDPGTEVGAVGTALDTLLQHVDSALATRTQTDRRMREFITNASHELRTPLAAISGYAELTRQDSHALPPMTEHALSRIESESHRMSSLVSDLLLLARLDEGQDLHLDLVDLARVAHDAVHDAQAAAADHTWSLRVDTRQTTVVGDPDRLHQLIANLLGNAAAHTPPGTSVEVRVEDVPPGRAPAAGDEPAAEAHSSWLRVSVRDDGPGIEPAILPHLFERFVRSGAQNTRGDQGAGLGLAIVASIVEAHQGTLAVDSDENGTVFTILLPRDSSPTREGVAPAAIGGGARTRG